MQITSVEYRRLRSFGTYENESVGATALIEDGETAEETLQKVRSWVNQELTVAQAASASRGVLDDLHRAVGYKQAEVERLDKTIQQMRDFLALHGVRIDALELAF